MRTRREWISVRSRPVLSGHSRPQTAVAPAAREPPEKPYIQTVPGNAYGRWGVQTSGRKNSGAFWETLLDAGTGRLWGREMGN